MFASEPMPRSCLHCVVPPGTSLRRVDTGRLTAADKSRAVHVRGKLGHASAGSTLRCQYARGSMYEARLGLFIEKHDMMLPFPANAAFNAVTLHVCSGAKLVTRLTPSLTLPKKLDFAKVARISLDQGKIDTVGCPEGVKPRAFSRILDQLFVGPHVVVEMSCSVSSQLPVPSTFCPVRHWPA